RVRREADVVTGGEVEPGRGRRPGRADRRPVAGRAVRGVDGPGPIELLGRGGGGEGEGGEHGPTHERASGDGVEPLKPGPAENVPPRFANSATLGVFRPNSA